MQEMHSQKLDKFELHLDEMIEKLQECQKSNSLKSCSLCKEYLSCSLRNEYIDAVYNSMSKGETGGFEF